MSENKKKATSYWSYKSTRMWITWIFCLTVTANALLRNTLSFAMVCMVVSNQTSNTQTSGNSSCASANDNQNSYQGTFEWNNFQQGLLFSALNIGGLFSALPAGWMADRYDPKTLVFVSMIGMTTGSLLSPVTAVHGGFVGFLILRLLMGLFGQAVIFCGIGAISARWIPPMERSTVIAIYTAGNQLCSVIGSPLNAFLCHSTDFLGGWPAIFYMNAIFGVLSIISWFIFVSNRPESNRFISESERIFIEESLVSQNLGKRKEVTKHIPWLKMLTSLPMLQVLLCNFAAAVMSTALQTYIPTYFKEVFYVNLLSNGVLSALPYLVQSISKVLFASIADYMKRHTKISPTWICKGFNSLSHFGAATFVIACSFMGCSSIGAAVALLCLANACLSANSAGYYTSSVSIAPQFSGMITSTSRLAGQIGSVIAPYMVSGLTPDGTQTEWQTVFFVISIIMIVSGVLFLIFGSAAIQEWAKVTPNDKLAVDKSSIIATDKQGNHIEIETVKY